MGDWRPLGLPLTGFPAVLTCVPSPVTDGPPGASVTASPAEEASCRLTHTWGQCSGFTFCAQGASVHISKTNSLES